MKKYLFLLVPGFVLLLGASLPAPSSSANQDLVSPALVRTDTFDQQAAIAKLREMIKGRENAPSEEVFTNIQLMNKIPAGRLLSIMEMGFSKSLGVNCTHCHNPKAWASESIPVKQVAREMWIMTGKINSELLKNIPNLRSEAPMVNCTTCHRGQIKPALSLE